VGSLCGAGFSLPLKEQAKACTRKQLNHYPADVMINTTLCPPIVTKMVAMG